MASNLVPRDEFAKNGTGSGSKPFGGVVDLTRYMAKHVRHLYEERNGEPLKEPLMQKSNFGVVVMADVSGYSHLTNHLKNRNDGAELLTQLINPYFHFVIDIIEKSGGDVVKFIGDAILVKWELKDQTKAECVALACSGCLRLLERLGNHFLTIPDEEKAFPLSMHIGLGVGEVYDMHLGSPKHGRFEYFLDGKALKEAVHLVNVASQRELVISDEALTYLQGEVALLQAGIQGFTTEKTKKKGGHILKSLKWLGEEDSVRGVTREKDPSPKDAYRMYLNESACERLIGGHISLINELRKLTVMFARFTSLKSQDEARQLYQKAMKGSLDIVRNYEGTLRQMVSDDKGTSIFIVFGLPPLSHENDALFGLRAALEMKRLLSSLFDEYAVSVTSGMLFSGIIGGRTRADHTVMGESVNLAARLMSSDMCENALFCDKETRDSCVSEISFDDEAIEFVTKKGKAIVYKVNGMLREQLGGSSVVKSNAAIAKQRTLDRGSSTEGLMTVAAPSAKFNTGSGVGSTSSNMFIGREAEMKTIVEVLKEFLTTNSTPPRLIIEGDGGTGKSAMFSHSVDQATVNSLSCCVAKGDEVDQSTPFFIFRDLVLDLVDLIHDELHDSSTTTESLDGSDPSVASSSSDGNFKISKSISGDIPNLAKDLKNSKSYHEMEGYTKKSSRSRSLYRSIRVTGVSVDKIVELETSPSLGELDEHDDNASAAGGSVESLHPPIASPAQPAHSSPSIPVLNDPPGSNSVASPRLPNDEENERTTLLLARLGSALEKVNIPKAFASTLALVFTVGKIGQNDMSAIMTSNIKVPSSASQSVRVRTSSAGPANLTEKTTRLEALSELLVRLVNQITVPPKAPRSNSVRTTALFPNGIVFAIDDAQWVDPLSWSLISALARRCPRLLFIMAMRPMTRSNGDVPTRLMSSPEARIVKLGGLSQEAVSKLVISMYGDGVQSIQDRLLETIMEKTGGNPLFVIHVAKGLKQQRNLSVSPQNELFLKGRQGLDTDFENLVPRDLQSAMLVQFDRINPSIQLLLRVAAVIGNTFSLQMVATIMEKERKMGIRECFDKLTSNEAVSFVGFETTSPIEEQSKHLDSLMMVFKSALLQKCVYSTLPFTERSRIHLLVAQLYEQQMNEENRIQVLPIALFHFERTGNIFKRILFLEGMASIHMANGLYADAAVVLKKLLNSLPMLESDRKTIFTLDRRSFWHRSLGQSYVAIGDWELGKGHLLESLRYLDEILPVNKNAMRWATVKLLGKQKKYFAKRNQPDREPEITDFVEIQKAVAKVDSLQALGEAFMHLGENDEATYCVLTRLNLCEALGETASRSYNLHFARAEAVVALSLYLQNRTSMASDYFARAEQLANRSDDPLDIIFSNIFHSIAYFSSGNTKECLKLVDINRQIMEVNGLRNNETTMAFLLMDLLCGNITSGLSRAREIFSDSVAVGEYNVVSAAFILVHLNLNPSLTKDKGELDNWVRIVVEAVKSSVRQYGTYNGMLILSILSWHYALHKEWSKCLECFERFMPLLSAPQNPSLGAATTVSTFLTCWTLLMWHRDGLPVEPGYQVTEYMQTAHSSEHETEEDAFSSALSAAGMHPSTTELHANTMLKSKPNKLRSEDKEGSSSWSASVGDRALKSSLSRESFDTAPDPEVQRAQTPPVKKVNKSLTLHSQASSVTDASSVHSASASSSHSPSLRTPESLTQSKRLYINYVGMLHRHVKVLKKQWAPLALISPFTDALELLERSDSTLKASALLEKAALSAPQGMVLLKLVLHVETIRFAGIPKGKKAIADRKKRLDELADQIKAAGMTSLLYDVEQMIEALPVA